MNMITARPDYEEPERERLIKEHAIALMESVEHFGVFVEYLRYDPVPLSKVFEARNTKEFTKVFEAAWWDWCYVQASGEIA